MSILVKNVILEEKKKDIFIEENKIEKIGENLDLKADEKIDGKG
jgi:dihydroorotase-like cyclic amidohydrolase